MKKILFSAAGIAAVIASPAFAQGTSDGGTYVQVQAGLATMNNPTFTVTDPSVTPNDTLSSTFMTKSAAGFQIEGGYAFAGGLKLGTEVRYQKNGVKGIRLDTFNGTAVTTAQADTLKAELFDDPSAITTTGTTLSRASGNIATIQQIGTMINVTYELPVGAIKPYLGGGAGFVASNVSVATSSGSSFRFGWQLKGGVAYAVATHVDIFADYSYRQVSSGKLSTSDPVTYTLAKTKSSFFSGGIRYNF